MRLIDADALSSILEEWEEKACDGTENDGSDGTTRVLHPVPTTTREMIDLIAEQPTIEADPVKHGLGDPRTNGDRIRTMSDEEIAEAIDHGISSDACDYCKENDHHCTGHTCQGKADKEVILEWLQQPAEEV